MKNFCHKLTTFLLVLFAGTCNTFAFTLQESQAVRIAKNWISERTEARLEFSSVETYDNGSQELYIIQFTEMWAIVRKESTGNPVVAYGSGSYHINEWSLMIINSIEKPSIPEETFPFKQYLSSEFVPTSKKRDAVEPLLSTQWGQRSPYNDLCPEDERSSNGHAPTGCGATAMSQVLAYWKYPATGHGSNSYTLDNYGSLSVDFSQETYNWENMTDHDIAKLNYHAGVSINMGYDYDESSSSISSTKHALAEHFKYKHDIQHLRRSNYSHEEWEMLIKTELSQGRPVIYRFTSTDGGGHAVVIDGYDDISYFHVNWGWNGSYDGYYNIDALNAGGKEYSVSHAMLTNIRPNPDFNSLPNITFSSNYNELIAGNKTDGFTTDDSYSFTRSLINNGVSEAINIPFIVEISGPEKVAYTDTVPEATNLSITKYIHIAKLQAGLYTLTATIDPDNIIEELDETDNVLSFNFAVAEQSSKVELMLINNSDWGEAYQLINNDDNIKNSYLAGDSVEIYFAAANIGAAPLDVPFAYTIAVDNDFEINGEAEITQSDKAIIFGPFFLSKDFETGQHTLRITLDPENTIDEINTENNSLETSFEVHNLRADITLSEISGWQANYLLSNFSDRTISEHLTNDSVFLYIAPVNQGKTNIETEFSYAVYVDNQLICTKQIQSLATDEIKECEPVFIGNQLAQGKHSLKILLDAHDDIYEQDETNNIFSSSFYVALPDAVAGQVSIFDRYQADQPLDEICTNQFFTVLLAVPNKGYGDISSSLHYTIQIDELKYTGWIDSIPQDSVVLITKDINVLFEPGEHTIIAEVDDNNSIIETDETNNSKEISFTVVDRIKPDLIAGTLALHEYSETGPQAGNTYTGIPLFLEYSFTNKEDAALTSPFQYTIYIDNIAIKTIDRNEIGAGEEVTGIIPIETELSAGEHRISITVDSNNDIDELKENNNSIYYPFTVSDETLPDLSITSMSYHQRNDSVTLAGDIYINSDLNFRFFIKNEGTKDITESFFTKVKENGVQLTGQSIDGLAAGDSVAVWEYLGFEQTPGVHELNIYVNQYNQIKELNTGNNTATSSYTVINEIAPDPKVSSIYLFEDSDYMTPATEFTINSSLYVSAHIMNFEDTSLLKPIPYVLTIDDEVVLNGQFDSIGINGILNLKEEITTPLQAGEHILKLAIDPEKTLKELNLTNNSKTISFTVIDQNLADINVLSPSVHISSTASSATQTIAMTDSVFVGFSVVNSSDEAINEPIMLTVLIDDISIFSKEIAGLAAQSSIDIFEFIDKSFTQGNHQIVVKAESDAAEATKSNNSNHGTFTVQNEVLPDLSLSAIMFFDSRDVTKNTDEIMQGSPFYITSALLNYGDKDITDSVSYTISIDGQELLRLKAKPIAVTEYASISKLISPYLELGTHTLSITADSDNSITESDETNNTRSADFTIIESPYPDLVATSMHSCSDNLGEQASATFIKNEPVYFSFTAQNKSNIDITDSCAYYIYSGNMVIAMGKFKPLSAQEEIQIVCKANAYLLSEGKQAAELSLNYDYAIEELSNKNNHATTEVTILEAQLPDLTVESLALSSSIDFSQPQSDFNEDDTVFINYTIANIGLLSAESFSLIISLDSRIQIEKEIDLIEAGETVEYTDTLVSIAQGEYTVSISVDILRSVKEAKENNNSASLNCSVTGNPKPDLQAESLSLHKAGNMDLALTEFTEDDEITYSFFISNNEVAVSDSFSYSITVDNILIDKTDIGSFDANGSQQFTGLINWELNAGSHTLRVYINSNGIVETDNANNIITIDFTVSEGLGKIAELEIPSLFFCNSINCTAAQTEFTEEEDIYFKYAIANTGNLAVSKAFRFIIAIDGSNKYYKGIVSLAPGETKEFSELLDDYFSKGTHTVEISLDTENTIAETDELNNQASAEFSLISTGKPDLALTTNADWGKAIILNTERTAEQASEIFTDDSVFVFFNVSNLSNISIDQAFGYELLLFGTEIAISGTASLTENSAVIGPIALGAGFTEGSQQLIVNVDYNNEIDEADENNIYGHGFSVSKQTLPDLSVTKNTVLNAPVVFGKDSTGASLIESATENQPFYVLYELSNQSTEAIHTSFTLAVYVDDELHSEQTYTGFTASESTLLSAELMLDAGEHSIEIVADPDNAVEESDETDNSSLATIKVTKTNLPVFDAPVGPSVICGINSIDFTLENNASYKIEWQMQPEIFTHQATDASAETASINYQLEADFTGNFSVRALYISGTDTIYTPYTRVSKDKKLSKIESDLKTHYSCGQEIRLEVTDNRTIEWSNGASGNAITVTEAGLYKAKAIDNNNCQSDWAEIASIVAFENVELHQKDEYEICGNDLQKISFYAGKSDNIQWFNQSGELISESFSVELGEGQYTYIHSTGECTSDVYTQTITQKVLPVPDAPLTDKSSLCEYDSFTLPELTIGTWAWTDGIEGNERQFSESGDYGYFYTKDNCSSDTLILSVELGKLPNEEDLISQDGNMLFIDYAVDSIVWYMNKTEIATNTSSIRANESAVYSISAKLENGCSVSKDIYHRMVVGIADNELSATVAPVPAKTRVWVECNTSCSFELVSPNGSLLRKGEMKTGANQLNIEELAKGVYWLTLKKNGLQKRYRLVK